MFIRALVFPQPDLPDISSLKSFPMNGWSLFPLWDKVVFQSKFSNFILPIIEVVRKGARDW